MADTGSETIDWVKTVDELFGLIERRNLSYADRTDSSMSVDKSYDLCDILMGQITPLIDK